MSSNPKDPLARAAVRAERSSAPMLAGLLSAWRRAFPQESAATRLSCDAATVSALALCMRPRSGRWLEDALAISRAVKVDPDLLVPFLREAESVERFATAHPVDDTAAGRLLAARDRDEDE